MSDQKEDKLETKGGAKAAGNLTQIYKAKLVLKAWGQKSDDVYAPRGEKYLEFDAVVDDKGKCKTCGSADNVDYLQYHPGKCSAYEWVYGVDIDWRWLCCGKHEDFRHEKYCEPNGFHKSEYITWSCRFNL